MNPYNPPLDWEKPLLSLDLETFPIGEGEYPTAPKPVVASLYDEAGNNLLIHHKFDDFDGMMDMALAPGHILIGQNIAYDICCLYYDRPELITRIFDKYEAGEIFDTMYAEKLINLTSVGVIEKGYVRRQKVQFRYDLGKLAGDYLGIDMSEDKGVATEIEAEISRKISEGGEWTDEEREYLEENKLLHRDLDHIWDNVGAWRTRYHHLYNHPIEKWPTRAKEYALNDSKYTYEVAIRQMLQKDKPRKPFAVLPFKVMNALDLMLMTSKGVCTNPENVEALEKVVEVEMADEKLEEITTAGIYVPAQPGRPYKTNPEKFTKDKPAKTSKEALQNHIIKMLKEGVVVKEDLKLVPAALKDLEFMDAFRDTLDGPDLIELLEGGRTKIKILKSIEKEYFQEYKAYLSADADFKANYSERGNEDLVMENYIHFMKWRKIKTTEIPRMKAPIIYPNYDALKETGRTSSYAGKLYPSGNIQQINAKVRNCYTAREGRYILSVDFKAMELTTAAQICLNMFGKSVLAEKINAGYDSHAYLGSQIALRKDPEFATILEDDPSLIDKPDEVYEIFVSLKDHEEYGGIYKKYRKLAKPVGLGFWGGLGAEKFITIARTAYGVEIGSEDEAKELKQIWHLTYPETKKFFKHITENFQDWDNTFSYVDPEGKDKTWNKYKYKTPYGMWRVNCDYCVVMNGVSLQPPGAEGALSSLHLVVREAFDPSKESVLFENFIPWGFVHDEINGDVPPEKAYECGVRVCELMKEGFKVVCPDIEVEGEPALMKDWYKQAESFFDHKNKTLSLWEPEDAE